jgi:hypothetical protein
LNELSDLDLSPLFSCGNMRKFTFDGDVTLAASADKKDGKMPLALTAIKGMIEWK